MIETRLSGLFVVGTDTGVGKTHVASAIARALVRKGHRVGVLKPVATGATRDGSTWRCDDAERLIAAIGGGVSVEQVAPILYQEALAPSVAARRAGARLEQQSVELASAAAIAWWETRADVIVVEGVGGLLCPLAEETTVADLAIALDYPLVIVARRGLGTLNHTLMTVEAARLRALRIAGVVLNSAEPSDETLAEATNAEELARRLPGVAILAERPHEPTFGLSDPADCVDWYERARPPRVMAFH